MIGMLLWKPPGKREKAVQVRERSILHTRFFCAEITRGPKTPEVALRRRVASAVKRLRRQNITQVVLPEDFPYLDQLTKGGLRPVSTLPLRRAIAADWVRWSLLERGIPTAGARVAVCAASLTGEVVRTVTELALRHRYLILKVPFGGEELCRRLRREYGVSIVLNPETEREPVSVHIAFDPTEAQGGGFLPLYDESLPMPRLLLPPEVEARLPEGLDRGQLLSVLWRTGALRPGQVSVQLEETENKGAVPEIRAFCP